MGTDDASEVIHTIHGDRPYSPDWLRAPGSIGAHVFTSINAAARPSSTSSSITSRRAQRYTGPLGSLVALDHVNMINPLVGLVLDLYLRLEPSQNDLTNVPATIDLACISRILANDS